MKPITEGETELTDMHARLCTQCVVFVNDAAKSHSL